MKFSSTSSESLVAINKKSLEIIVSNNIKDDGRDILIQNVSFSYNRRPVLENINLSVQKREFIAVVGPNGGGKSTLLKLVLGIFQPNKGEILVFGIPPGKSGSRIGYMPQRVNYDPSFPATAMDVVLMGRLGKKLGGRYSKRDKEAAKLSLEEVKMAHLADYPLFQLSGGQRQRVLIARALCCEPELLLLDEPTANIDYETEQNIFGILRQLNKRMTILMVSHNIGLVSQMVSSVICVNRKAMIHPTSEVDGLVIKDIYGDSDLRMIRHDHRCGEEGHNCAQMTGHVCARVERGNSCD